MREKLSKYLQPDFYEMKESAFNEYKEVVKEYSEGLKA
jgi:hypothetical protein